MLRSTVLALLSGCIWLVACEELAVYVPAPRDTQLTPASYLSKTPLVKWAQRRNSVMLSIPYGRGEGRGTVSEEKVHPITRWSL